MFRLCVFGDRASDPFDDSDDEGVSHAKRPFDV
jgi:hypothetical protein